ncbi:MAG: DNA topoisomerase I [Nanoarchaeota archaeon]
MSYELIVTEKPSQAKKIAESLAEGKPTVKKENGVSYFILNHDGQDIVIAPAVGHVYSLAEEKKSFSYPSYDIKWYPAYEVDKNSKHTSKYINVIKKLAKDADTFTVATDFDVEGEVIGLNVIRFACKQKDANRMKFSTLTKPDLVKSYKNKLKRLEWGQANAGETRHFLDWMYGINISRALSTAIRKAGLFKSMSSGRVQGPALKLIVDKEKEIRKFVPVPFWQITYDGRIKGEDIHAEHEKDKFWDKEEAKNSYELAKGNDGHIKDKRTTTSKSQPPTPFDLTTLQTESFRSLKIRPKDTLALAQDLYSMGYTSYPRTSSQQLPPELGYKKLISSLKRHPIYKPLAEKLLSSDTLKPNNGKKTDPAHPAIYPTGVIPDTSKLNSRQAKVYDLIVRRFLATFSEAAIRETNKIHIDVNGEKFIVKGIRTTKQGWFEFYGSHVKLEEQTLPNVQRGEVITHKKTELHTKETKPPKRFTPSSLIKELEKRNLGTKATRASIIDTLFQRGYVTEKTLEPTEIGIRTVDVLDKYVPDIIQEELTRRFEEEMERIRDEKKTEHEVLEEAKHTLDKILKQFKEQEKNIGSELMESLKETQDKENTIGDCPACKQGKLMIRYSKKNRQKFIGCSNYPDCRAVFSLPGSGQDVKPSIKTCEHCDYPMIEVGKGRSKQTVCFNMDCPAKKKEQEKELDPVVKDLLEKPCPNCGSMMKLRKSVYGEFMGCSNYPKCKTIIQIPKNEGEKPKVIDYNKKSSKKSAKKSSKKNSSKKKASNKVTKKTSKKTSK